MEALRVLQWVQMHRISFATKESGFRKTRLATLRERRATRILEQLCSSLDSVSQSIRVFWYLLESLCHPIRHYKVGGWYDMSGPRTKLVCLSPLTLII